VPWLIALLQATWSGLLPVCFSIWLAMSAEISYCHTSDSTRLQFQPCIDAYVNSTCAAHMYMCAYMYGNIILQQQRFHAAAIPALPRVDYVPGPYM
jgi:hypothetical protein